MKWARTAHTPHSSHECWVSVCARAYFDLLMRMPIQHLPIDVAFFSSSFIIILFFLVVVLYLLTWSRYYVFLHALDGARAQARTHNLFAYKSVIIINYG